MQRHSQAIAKLEGFGGGPEAKSGGVVREDAGGELGSCAAPTGGEEGEEAMEEGGGGEYLMELRRATAGEA